MVRPGPQDPAISALHIVVEGTPRDHIGRRTINKRIDYDVFPARSLILEPLVSNVIRISLRAGPFDFMQRGC